MWWNWKYVMESLDEKSVDKHNKWVESKKKKEKKKLMQTYIISLVTKWRN